jgi:tetratricopeptide (TPR) repeat protein
MIKINLKSVLLIAGMFCTICVSSLKAQTTLKDAITFTKNEQYDKAEALFQQLIKSEPANSKNYFYYGENTLLNYFSDTISTPLNIAAKDAKDIFNKGIAANPAEPLNYVGLARVAFYLGDNAAAEEMRVKAKSLLPPYKKVTKIANPKDYAFTLAKIGESYIRFEEVDTSKALPFIREALKIDSKNSDVYIIAGDIYILENDGSKAIKNYNLAQDWDLQSPTANMKIGNIYVKGRNLMAAIPSFEQAINLNANYAPAYRELGQLYLMAGKYDKSKEYFKKYLDLTQGNIPAKIKYGNALFYAKDYKGVIKNVEEIFAVDNSRTYMNRIAGYSAYEEGEYDLALTFMDKLFASLPEDRIIKKDYIYLAKILLKKNQNYSKQAVEVEKDDMRLAELQSNIVSLKGAPKDKMKADIDALAAKVAESHNQIAKADVEISRAFDAYEKAINFEGEDLKLINEKATYQSAYRRNVDAGDTWSRLLSKGRDSENDYIQTGKAYYIGKAFDKADAVFNQLVAKYPESLQGYVWIANTASAKDPDSKLGLAEPKFEYVLQRASSDSIKYSQEMFDALRYLGYYSLSNQKYEAAKGYYTRMLNLAPDNNDFKIKAYSSLATMHFQMGEYPKAIENTNKVLAIDPQNVNAKEYLTYINATIANSGPKKPANQISGVIKDNAGTPLNGASVRVKDTAAEAWTNAKGEYTFVMPEASTVLVVSAKGYQTKEVPVTKVRIYNVTLNK